MISVFTRRRRNPRYAVRKPKGYRVEAPGDLGEVDTLRVQLIPNEEFFEVEDLSLVTTDLNRQIEGWEYTYNHIRPRQELDYLTPYEYYCRWKKNQKSQVSPMS